MRFQLRLVLVVTLVAIVLSPTAAVHAQGNSSSTFDTRFAQTTTDSRNFVSPTAEGHSVRGSKFHTMLFHTLGDTAQPVRFELYSRVEYYSLTPEWDGNIEVPDQWRQNPSSVTASAHKNGSAVDLVISIDRWWFEGGTTSTPGFDEQNGVWLTKSYVLLNLIDNISSLVNQYHFDGVTLDFRLPPDVDTAESFAFLISQLDKRLKQQPVSSPQDIFNFGTKKLNVVVDAELLAHLKTASVGRDVLNGFWQDLILHADSVIVPQDQKVNVETALATSSDALGGLSKPSVVTLLNDANRPIPSAAPIAVWDTGNPQDMFQSYVATLYSRRSGIDKLGGVLCSWRTPILDALLGLSPLFAAIVLISWVYYNFPPFVSRIAGDRILFGIWLVFVLVLGLTLVSVPYRNLGSIPLVIVMISLAIPAVYFLWNLTGMLRKEDYP